MTATGHPAQDDAPGGHDWLAAEAERLWRFAEGAVDPAGGFGWLDDDGTRQAGRPAMTWITTRMTHVFALAHLAGRDGAAELVDHGVAALWGPLRDERDGGWFTTTGRERGDDGEKRMYDHAFVVLAASSAAVAGRQGAADLLAEALEVVDRRFWVEADGMCVDVWDRGFARAEAYRGINANMHAVEAFLAAADAGGGTVWRERAARITRRVLDGWARAGSWRVPEHFDPSWAAMPDYNRNDPGHPFRPFGHTVGHALEWARLALHVRAAAGADGERDDWPLECSRALVERAVADGWAADGVDGFAYTTDAEGVPVVRDRLHWVVCEGVAAASALYAVTGLERYAAWYRQWWQHAEDRFVDRDRGSWRHQLGADLTPAGSVWSGKPDVYHALQATLVPRLPLAPSMAGAVRDGLLG